MTVVRKGWFEKREKTTSPKRVSKIHFIDKRSFSTKKIFRNHPLLAGIHRGIDGALVGVIFCTALMSALALHSQYLWTRSFGRLERTRDLNERIEESITNLERYFLASPAFSEPMVPTKATDLLYLDAPVPEKTSFNFFPKLFEQLGVLTSRPAKQGY